MKKSILMEIIENITVFNKRKPDQTISLPFSEPLIEGTFENNIESPFVFRFYVNEKQARYVLVDDKLPFLEE